jgi:hypothetical protein
MGVGGGKLGFPSLSKIIPINYYFAKGWGSEGENLVSPPK